MKSVLITGAGSGIGLECAKSLGLQGYRVFAGVKDSRERDTLLHLAAQGVKPIRLDVTSPDEVAQARQQIEGFLAGEGLFALINNAARVEVGPIEILTDKSWRETFDTNVLGAARILREFLPLLLNYQGSSRILAIGSINARMASPYLGPYSSSKAAFESLHASLRRELKHSNLRISILSPGPVRTPLWRAVKKVPALISVLSEEQRRRYGNGLERLANLTRRLNERALAPEELARLVLECLHSSRPRAYYAVGRYARLLSCARRFIPEESFDRWLSP